MSFSTALSLTLALVVFVLTCTMANLLARITRLERFAERMAGVAPPAPDATDVPVPDAVAVMTKGTDPARLLLLSASCTSCDDAVAMVQHWPDEDRRATFLVYRDEPPHDLVAPAGVRVVTGAKAVFESLAVVRTPAFVHIEGGVIAGRSSGLPDNGHAHAPVLTDLSDRPRSREVDQ